MKRARPPAWDYGALVLAVILAVVLGRTQSMARDRGETDHVSRLIRTAVSPAAVMANGIGRWGGYVGDGFINGPRLRNENLRLQAAALTADLYDQNTARLEREIEELRRQLLLPIPPGKTRIPADVIGYFPTDNRLTLSAGSDQGVKPGAPVINGFGILGTVQTVEKGSCQALLLTSRTLKIGGIVLDRDPPPAGLVQGENGAMLILTLIDAMASVQVGDRIVTSGFSENIPRGIPIGKVIQVEEDPDFGEKRARIDPYFAVGTLREVSILR